MTWLRALVRLRDGLRSIREGTYINRNTVIDAHTHLEIGRDCMIGPHCCITDADHGTSPAQVVSIQPMVAAPVRIGDNVWVGATVVVLKGVTIDAEIGAEIGAGAVVTRDVPAAACWKPRRPASIRGGHARALERRRILGRHIRPVTLDCIGRGMRGEAWHLYRGTMGWHIAMGRWKYLTGFPVKAIGLG